jgi:hypothetical protein
MSVARGYGLNGRGYFTNVCKPQVCHLNFTVDSTNGNGLGIRSLKSNGFVESVYMNTSAAITGTVTSTSFNITAIAQGTSSLQVGMPVQGTGIPAGTTITGILSSGSVSMSAAATSSHTSESITYQGIVNGYANPNPAAGLVLVRFKNNFNYYLGGFTGFVSPIGSPTTSTNSGLTSGAAYVITVLGNTTLAEWQSIGLPAGFTPTVGQTIIVPSGVTGTGGSHTGKVGIPGVSGITSLEVLGDPNQLIANSNIAANAGAVVALQMLGATNSTTTTLIPTAPANNSACGMTFYFDGSSVTIDGI